MASPKSQANNRTDRVQKAVDELHKCVHSRFTGNITIDFSEGVAILCRKTEVTRYAKDAQRVRLDGGGSPR